MRRDVVVAVQLQVRPEECTLAENLFRQGKGVAKMEGADGEDASGARVTRKLNTLRGGKINIVEQASSLPEAVMGTDNDGSRHQSIEGAPELCCKNNLTATGHG